MIKISDLMTWSTTFLVLVLLPEEHQIFLRGTTLEQRYGELEIQADDTVYLVAKNSSASSIDQKLDGAIQRVARHVDQMSGEKLKQADELLPSSISVALIERRYTPSVSRRVQVKGSRSFAPYKLELKTKSDDFLLVVFAVVMMVAFGLLTLSLAGLSSKDLAQDDINNQN